MSCTSCLEIKIPECISTLIIDGILAAGVTYILVFENHFGKKNILVKSASAYTATITIDVLEDLPDGYFFRGNTYTLKAYASTEDYQCDSPANICQYETCLSLVVSQVEGGEDEFTINCCA